MSPFYICNSPAIESRHRKFIAPVRDDHDTDTEDSEAQHPEDVLDEFHARLTATFEQVFLEVAPNLPPSFDPAKLAAGQAHRSPITSFPKSLSVDSERNTTTLPHLRTRQGEPVCQGSNEIWPELEQELRQHVKFLDPSATEVSFREPGDVHARGGGARPENGLLLRELRDGKPTVDHT